MSVHDLDTVTPYGVPGVNLGMASLCIFPLEEESGSVASAWRARVMQERRTPPRRTHGSSHTLC